MRPEVETHKQPSHARLVRLLVLISVGMFGFGFAMWPLYYGVL